VGSNLAAILTTVLVGPRKYTGEVKGWLLTAFQLLSGNVISRAAPGRISMAFERVSQRVGAIHRPQERIGQVIKLSRKTAPCLVRSSCNIGWRRELTEG
jgi:hypothetical protein